MHHSRTIQNGRHFLKEYEWAVTFQVGPIKKTLEDVSHLIQQFEKLTKQSLLMLHTSDAAKCHSKLFSCHQEIHQNFSKICKEINGKSETSFQALKTKCSSAMQKSQVQYFLHKLQESIAQFSSVELQYKEKHQLQLQRQYLIGKSFGNSSSSWSDFNGVG